MSDDQKDQRLLDLLYEATVPLGYRPESDEEIEAMLDACSDIELSEQQIARMLRRASGDMSAFIRPVAETVFEESMLSESQKELVALHRAKGTALPPEVTALLQRLRDQARMEDHRGSDGK
jgi:hypothetical protein